MKLTVIESVVKALMPATPNGWHVGHEVYVPPERDGWEIRAWTCRRGASGEQLRKTYRGASVDIDPRDVIEFERRNDKAIVNYFRDRLQFLFTLLFPPPLPNFRIGTKNHAKRLAAR